jgi:hypothetical protein
MSGYFTVAVGSVLIKGKSPDGDSIRFVPNNLDTLRGLPGGGRIRPSLADGSIQLRLDAIDAPETHYAGQRQPLADVARDELLAFTGFHDVTYDDSGTVSSSEPDRRTALIASKLVETHGRPVVYLFPTPRQIDPPLEWGEGDKVTLDENVLVHTVNAHMVSTGRAYITLYTSTPPELRRYLTDLAQVASSLDETVWAADHSRRFTLIDRDSIGEGGALILPKLFRRATDYLTARGHGQATSFLSWLTQATADGFPENDEVEIGGRRLTLADLIYEEGTTLGLDADLLDLVFVEK